MALVKDFDANTYAKIYTQILREKFPATNFGVSILYNPHTWDYEVLTYITDGRKHYRTPPVRQPVKMNLMYRNYELSIVPTDEVYTALMLLGAE